jgi:adenylate kinase
VKTGDDLFSTSPAVDMALDILAERGYHAVYQELRAPVPRRFDPQTGAVTCEDRTEHSFEITFHSPEIRRGH